MGKGNGLTEAVMALLSVDCPMSVAEVVAAVAEEHKTSAGAILTQKFGGGHLLRTGEPRHYRYSLKPQPPAEDSSAADETGAGMPDQPPSMSASLGTVCRIIAPANKSEGTIEQALYAVLDLEEGLTLDEILLALPIGWSRTEALSALTEGVHGDWIASSNSDGRTHYRLAGAPTARPANSIAIGVTAVTEAALTHPPLAVANFRERVDFMRLNLRALLKDGCSEPDVPCVLLQHLAEAGTAIDNAYNTLT